jgi:predicted acetyltransferase
MTILTTNAERSWPSLEVFPALPEQQPILGNLLELYIYDFSELRKMELGRDGRFGYPNLPLYWHEPARHPLLVRMDGGLIGFALVKRGSEISGSGSVWDMAEFFVLRGYRGRGFGTEIAQEIWKRFPGHWEVRVMQSNRSAHRFWQRAITRFRGNAAHSKRVEKDGKSWRLFSFTSEWTNERKLPFQKMNWCRRKVNSASAAFPNPEKQSNLTLS